MIERKRFTLHEYMNKGFIAQGVSIANTKLEIESNTSLNDRRPLYQRTIAIIDESLVSTTRVIRGL